VARKRLCVALVARDGAMMGKAAGIQVLCRGLSSRSLDRPRFLVLFVGVALHAKRVLVDVVVDVEVRPGIGIVVVSVAVEGVFVFDFEIG